MVAHSTILEEEEITPAPLPQDPVGTTAQIHHNLGSPTLVEIEEEVEEEINTPSPQTLMKVVDRSVQRITSLSLFSPDTSSDEEEDMEIPAGQEIVIPSGFFTSPDSSPKSPQLPGSPQLPRFRVRRHQNTQRKLTDWHLEVEKKWVILGDSNLSRFPDFLNQDLQIDCYPGSNFQHAQAMLEKLEPPGDLLVEKVVLAFGTPKTLKI